MKVFYVLALAGVLLSAGCDNTIYGTPGGTAPLLNLGTWTVKVEGTNSPSFSNFKLFRRGADLFGTASVSLSPSQHPQSARLSGSVGPDGGFKLQIFFDIAPQREVLFMIGMFTPPNSAKGTVSNRTAPSSTPSKFSMRRTGP